MKVIRTARSLVALAIGGALISGCTSMAGVGGTAEYGCKAPEGVKCDSVSGTYYNSVENNLPSQRPGLQPSGALALAASPSLEHAATAPRATSSANGVSLAHANASVVVAAAAYTSMPLRSSARVLRLWVKPWEDADGDLVDQVYVYVPVDHGRWLVDHAQRQIRDAYAPIRPPRKPVAVAHDGERAGDARAAAGSDLESRLQAARGMPFTTNSDSGPSDGR